MDSKEEEEEEDLCSSRASLVCASINKIRPLWRENASRQAFLRIGTKVIYAEQLSLYC